MPKPKRIVLIEDHPFWEERYVRAFEALKEKENCVLDESFQDAKSASEYIIKHHKTLYGVLSDMRIKAGPKQDFHPPLDTALPYGLWVVKRMADAGIREVPVVAYSQYFSKGSATRKAVEEALREYDFLVGAFTTKDDVRALVKKALAAFEKFRLGYC